MSLQLKFALLLGFLGLTVFINIAAAAWAVRFYQRELGWAIASIEPVLTGLHEIKRAAADQALALSGPDDRTRFEQLSRRIDVALTRLNQHESYYVRSGASTTRNLEQRVEQINAAAGEWFEGGAQPDQAVAVAVELARLRSLIEGIEAHILDDARQAVPYTQWVRERITIIFGASFAAVLIALLLGMRLVRRWVLLPVAALRDAAARIGRGDFEYRVGYSGSDELALLSGEVDHMASLVLAMQEERVERERLAAVGEMTRRIAHNIRNPLAGIRSLAELTESELPDGSDLKEPQARIVQAVDRFDGWLTDLLKASTPLDLAPAEHLVAPWLEGLAEAHRPLAQARSVELIVDSQAAPERAEFDARHLEHAVVGILTNAIEATPEGGVVQIRAQAGENGQGWTISISDQGSGISDDLKDKIFRAYFTTKPTGSGIGLAVARQVVEQHGGVISVESAPETDVSTREGRFVTHFHIRLPGCVPSRVANTGQQDHHGGESSNR